MDERSTRERIEDAMAQMHAAGCKMTISSVAKEAGVSNATIHNRYPDLAQRIRELAGDDVERSAQQTLTKRRGTISRLREQIRALTEDNTRMRDQLRAAHSVNAALALENDALKAESARGRPPVLRPRDT